MTDSTLGSKMMSLSQDAAALTPGPVTLMWQSNSANVTKILELLMERWEDSQGQSSWA